MAYKRIRLALNIHNAFKRTERDSYHSCTENSYGKYKSKEYSIILDGDLAFFDFNMEKERCHKEVLIPVCDALMLPHNIYELEKEDK